MNAETIEAVTKSVEHWERMASGTNAHDEKPVGRNCPLCRMFFNHYAEEAKACDGCPVFERGFLECEGSPYTDARDAWWDFGMDSDAFKKAAKAEVEFLKSLLPPPPPTK